MAFSGMHPTTTQYSRDAQRLLQAYNAIAAAALQAGAGAAAAAAVAAVGDACGG
jgi:hypothetical protein